MITWVKSWKRVSPEGTTIRYDGLGTDYSIESRKRHIPHANGKPGTWDHTTYFVLRLERVVVEKYSLKDAKEFVENERRNHEEKRNQTKETDTV